MTVEVVETPAAPVAAPAAPAAPVVDPVVPDISLGTKAPEPSAPSVPEYLRSFKVDPEIAGHSSLSAVKSVEDLAKSYVHAQKLIGADKVVLPSKHATPAEWKDFFHKSGLPKELKDYKVEIKDALLASETIEQYKSKAHELGIFPHQTQAILEMMNGETKAARDATLAQENELHLQTVKSLQSEYGKAFDSKIGLYKAVVQDVCTPEEIEYIKETGLDTDGTFIRMMVKFGEKHYTEEVFNAKSNPSGALSPNEAKEQINAIYNNREHPYFNDGHPNHRNAVEEMLRLQKFVK